MPGDPMPRPLRDYTRKDWARLRPVTQTYKTLRYDAVNALYMRRPAKLSNGWLNVPGLESFPVFAT